MNTPHAFLLAALLTTGSLMAQEADWNSASAPKIQIGPILSINVTSNTADYHVSGPERSYVMGSLIGVGSDIPIGKNMSVVASIGYYTLGFSDKNKAVDLMPADPTGDLDLIFPSGTTLKTEGSFNYLAIAPMFRYSNFCIGFSLDIPLTAKITNTVDPLYYSNSIRISDDERYVFRQDISPPSSERNVLIEGRIAGDWALFESPSGSLHLGVTASYPFTTMIASAKGEDVVTDLGNGQTKTTKTRFLPHLDDNFRLPSLQLGISYLFSM